MNVKALLLVDEQDDKIRPGEIQLPGISKGEVLIKIRAAALNHRDQWCREGMYPALEYGRALGSDGCGIVEEIGEDVDKSWLNKRVIINPNINWGNVPEVQSPEYNILGMPTNGTLSEYVIVPEHRIISAPDHLSDAEAAAVPLGGLTAYRAVFNKGQVKQDQNVLITGIGGGVSQFAFLFCKMLKANVYVNSSSDEKIDKALELGAQGGYNYRNRDWYKLAKRESGGFDVIIDSAGGDNINTYLKIINMGGRMVHYGSTTGMPNKLDIFKLFWSQASIHGTSMGNDIEFKQMVDFISQHRIKPIIDSIRPFDQVVSAFDEMKQGKQFGKLVISFEN